MVFKQRGSSTLHNKFSFVHNHNERKYVRMYEKFISQFQMYANPIRVLSLPISLLPPMKKHEILKEVKKTIQFSNPDYDVVITRLHLFV